MDIYNLMRNGQNSWFFFRELFMWTK